MGGGGDTSQNTSPFQQSSYGRLLGSTDSMFEKGGGFFDDQYGGGMPTRAGMSPEQIALQERLMGPQGSVNQAITGLEKSLGPYDPNNPALSGAIDAASSDVYRNLKENELPGIGDAGVGAGQFGSSRHGVAEGIATRGAIETSGDIATQMRLADMQRFEGDKANAISNLGNITQGIEMAGSGMQREEQAGLDDLFRRWEYESGVPLKDLQAYKGLISGDMGGSAQGSAGK